MTMCLAGILMAVTIVSMRAPTNSAGSRGLADQLAESFRAARNQAIVEQSPVALFIPTQAGKVCSQSVAMMHGQQNPFNSYVHNYGREFPNSVIFVGTYPSSTTWSKDPIQTGFTNFWQIPLAGSPDNPIRSWLGTHSDFTFIFTPDGVVHGNDLPHLGSDYVLVVSQGITAGAGSAAGTGLPVTTPPPEYGLTGVCKPYSVVVGATGSVRVIPGLLDSSGGVTLSPSPLDTANVAAAPTLSPEPFANPSVTRLSFNPQGSAGAGLGVAATLDPNRQVQVNVSATISSSDDLFCNIVCTGFRPSTGSATPGGTFATPGAKRMQYIPPAGGPFFTTGSWLTTWQWNPPPGALMGDEFNFEATVTTRRGGLGSSAALGAAQKKLQIYSKGKIYFGGQDPYTMKYEIDSIRADGTDLTHVTNNEASTAQLFPAATRDGNKLLFAAVEPMLSADLFALSRTGGLSTRITVDNKPALHSHFSDDSAVGVFERTEDFATSDYQLWTFDPNSLWPPSLTKVFNPSPALTLGCTSPALSDKLDFVVAGPASDTTRRCDAPRRIAFESDCKDSGKRAIYTANFCNPGTPKNPAVMNVRRQTDGGPANILNDRGDRYPAWHPSCKWLAFQSDRTGNTLVYKIDFDENGHETGPDNAVCLTPGMNLAREPYYSPDGKSLCFLSNDPPVGQWDIHIIDIDPVTGNAIPGSHRQLMLSNYTFFTGGFPNLNRPTWTQ